jgi:hypothetical protein
MEYKDIEELWQAEVAKITARHASEMVALQFNHREQIKQLQAEIERLNELVPKDTEVTRDSADKDKN